MKPMDPAPRETNRPPGETIPDGFILPYFGIVSVVFLLALSFGYLAPSRYQAQIAKALLSHFSPLETHTHLQLFIKIFLNNYLSTLLALLIGLAFGLGPVLFLVVNGFAMGILISFASAKVGLYKIGLAIVPHGIFEVPALLIASSYGLWWGVKNYRRIRYRDCFREHFALPMKRFLHVVVPLLLIGAFVEAYITPFVIRTFL